MAGGRIGNVQISHRGRDDEPGELADLYGALLGLERIFIGYHKLVHPSGAGVTPDLGFEYSPEDEPPPWPPDPTNPPQVHLDLGVADVDAAVALARSFGAVPLSRGADDGSVIVADPAGHPFCLVPDPGAGAGRLLRIVFDCVSPRSLAAFYADLLGYHRRVVDTPWRVELAPDDDDPDRSGVHLAFQHSVGAAPSWPDPARPAHLHLDLTLSDEVGGIERAERLGAVLLPLPARPDNHVYADPAGHPFCLSAGYRDWGATGPEQVAQYEAWLAEEGGGGG